MAHNHSLVLRVVASSRSKIFNSHNSVADLLRTLCAPALGANALVQVEDNHTCLVSLIPIRGTSVPNFYDGVKEATNYIAGTFTQPYLVFQFNIGTESKNAADPHASHLMVISKYEGPTPYSAPWSYDDEAEDIDNINEKSQVKGVSSWIPLRFRSKYHRLPLHSGKEPIKRHLMLWVLIALVSLATVVTVSYVLKNRDHQAVEKPWLRYPTPRSEGPRYQLEFNHHNVSSWAAENPVAKDEYYIRVDDGCMFAPHLVDEQELHYQRLLDLRYPQLYDLRAQRKYLDEGFLGDPFAIQIEVDNTFHLAHCVLAVRRYWWARETGKHVCPKDLDFRHIRHCLDVFDSWVFPDEFPQHTHGQVRMAESPSNETSTEKDGGWDMNKPAWFVWKQEVCF